MANITNKMRSENTYKRFIEAVIGIIAKGDIENFTIRSLCTSLGLSPRTFYLYFESKEQAVVQCYFYYMERLMDEVGAVSGDFDSAYDKVLGIFDAKIDVSLGALKLGRELYVCLLHHYDSAMYSDSLPLYKAVISALNDCEREGVVFNEPLRAIAWELIDFSRGIVFNFYLKNETYDLKSYSHARMQKYLNTFIVK